MNMANDNPRAYASRRRAAGAQETRAGILAAARDLFARRGVEAVKIDDVAAAAGVAGSTVYAVFKSKEGILRALMRDALFGERYAQAQALIAGVDDPVRMIAMTPQIARTIYETESVELGFLRGVAAWSPALRTLDREFEEMRYAAQEQRLRRLFEAGKAKPGLALEDARRILWMYTSRDVYRMLVEEGGWTPARYEAWLADVLIDALVAGDG